MKQEYSPQQRRILALWGFGLAQVLVSGSIVLSTFVLIKDAYIANKGYVLTPENVLGIALLLLVLPVSLALLWTSLQIIASTDKELGLSLARNLCIGMAVKCALLAGISGHFVMQPETLLDDAPDQLSMYIGGWIVAALLPLGLAYAVSAAAQHVRAAPGKAAAEQPARWRNAAIVLVAIAVFMVVFFFSCVGIPIWNAWYTPKGYFSQTSKYSLLSSDTTWKFRGVDVIVKLYADTLVFFAFVFGLAALALLSALSVPVKKLLRTRIAVSGKATAFRVLNPIPYGTSIGEVLVVSSVMGLFVWWAWWWGQGFDYIRTVPDIQNDNNKHLQIPARVLGHLTTLGMSLLIVPVMRNGVIEAVFGVPFERAVKYHRWLGSLTYLLVTSHFLLWAIKWGKEGTLAHNLFTINDLTLSTDIVGGGDPVKHADNFTIGFTFLAWIALSASVLLAVFARRQAFEWFYNVHVYVGVVFYAVALTHAWTSWYYISAPLVLWYFDRMHRVYTQQTGACNAHAATYSPSARVTTLVLPASSLARRHEPGQFVWMALPAIDAFQWHPFTIASPPTDSHGTPATHITLRIRDLGGDAWTHSLAKHVAANPVHGTMQPVLSPALKPETSVNTTGNTEDEMSADLLSNTGMPAPGVRAEPPLAVLVDGPYGQPVSHLDSERVLFAAGGIGITPMLSMAEELLHRDKAGTPLGTVRHATLVWCAREEELLASFAPQLLALVTHTEGRVKFSLQLHLTSKAIGTVEQRALSPARGEMYSAVASPEWAALQETCVHTGRPNWPQVMQGVEEGGQLPASDADPLLGATAIAHSCFGAVCGPESLVAAVSAATASRGWGFHYEEFHW